MGRETTQVIRDKQRRGWFAVEKPATQAIRLYFVEPRPGLRLSTALGFYATLCELANDARGQEVTRPRKLLATMAGVNPKAVSEYQAALEAAGVIEIEHRVIDGVNLPNIISLIDVDEAVPASGPEAGGRGLTPPGVGAPGPGGSGPEAPLHEEGKAEEREEEARVPRASSPGRVTYKGKPVAPDVVAGAEHLLEVYCEKAGRELGARTATGGPSPALKQIVGAMLDRPHVDVDRWEAAVTRTCAAPPDWVDGPVQVGHVFGERAAEWALAPPSATSGRNGRGPSVAQDEERTRRSEALDRVLAGGA